MVDSSYNFKGLSKDLYPYFIPEIKLSKEEKLFKKIIEAYSFSKNGLRVFDHWNDNVNYDGQISILDHELRARKIQTPFGYVYCSDPVIHKPKMSSQELTPKYARMYKHTYSGELKCKLNFVSNNEAENASFSVEGVSLGNIPIALGSKYCHLHGKNDKELLEMGENPVDPFSYFIIYGTEITIVTQEKLRSNEFLFFYNSKGMLEGRFTSSSFIGTSLLCMNLGKKWPCVKISMKHIQKSKHIPLFVLFEFLGVSIQEAIYMILEYVKTEHRSIIFYGLQTSITKARYFPDYVSFWAKKRELNTSNYDEILKTMIDDINRDCFAEIETVPTTKRQLEDFRIECESKHFIPVQLQQIEKAKHLAYMAARMVEIMQGLRKIDDRNSCSNIKLEIGGKSYEQLFINMFDDVIQDAQTKANAMVGNKDVIIPGKDKSSTFKKIDQHSIFALIKINKSIISDNSTKSFNANSWGHKGARKKENITDPLKRETILSIYSQNDKINTPANRNAPRVIRALKGSQLRRLCLAETPEGTNCGLVNHSALTLWISLERSPKTFYEFLETKPELISDTKTEECNFPLLVNGRIYAWCSKQIVNETIKQRRKDLLPRDSAIIFNGNNNSVEYYCNGTRACAPLLVVENDELLIDKKKLWDADIDTLYKEGVIELLDIKEEENRALVSEFTENVRKKKARIDELENKKIMLKTKRHMDDDEYKNLVMLYRNIYSKDILENLLLLLKDIIDNNVVDLDKYKLLLMENKDKIKSLAILRKYLLVDNNFVELHNQLEMLNENYDYVIEEIETDIELYELKSKKNYTHSEIHPVSMFGISCGLIPDGSSNPGPRITYQGSMGKQALQNDPSHYERMSDAGKKISPSSTRSLWETVVNEPAGLNIVPAGQTMNVAYYMDPDNIEDAQVYCKEFLDSYNFEVVKYATYSSTKMAINKYISEAFCNPNKDSDRYHAVDDNGIPIVGKFVRESDCIIGKLRTVAETDERPKKIENASVFLGIGEDGYIERVSVTGNEKNETMVIVKIGILRKYVVGDKAASRYSQKGTMGAVKPARELIRVASGPNKGVVPDLIINPFGIPSRMTIAMLKEMLTSKGALFNLERINATCYNKIDIDYFRQVLKDNGMDEYGNEEMCLPNGQMLKCKVFFGPCTYQALRHHVADKVQIRNRGNKKLISNQPVSGRSNRGGLRIGEMERDAIIEFGASSLLLERLMEVSDAYRTVYCSNCGNIALSNVIGNKGSKISCKFCGKSAKFGTLQHPFIYLLIYRMFNAIGMNCVLKLESQVEQGDNVLVKYLN